jgi:hypothetical protein
MIGNVPQAKQAEGSGVLEKKEKDTVAAHSHRLRIGSGVRWAC